MLNKPSSLLQIEADPSTVDVDPTCVKATSGDVMNWDVLLESFGKITTECNSSDASLDPLVVDSVDITELLFDDTNAKTEPNTLPIDYDLASLTLSPFALDKSDKKDDESWVDISNLHATVTLIPEIVTPKMEIKPKAMQLALANEIEVQAPWVDVSALAASISETPVSIKEKTPESIFTLATFVPTHMQSYIDLSTELAPTANVMTHTSFDLDTPEILQVSDKIFNDSKIVNNIEHSKLFNDSGIVADLETTKLFNGNEANMEPKLDSDIELFFGSDDDRSLNTPPPCKVQQKIEINPANSVLFNTDLDLEDTLLFDNEPPSDMYVVRTENIFGKEIAKRNALQQLTADTGICSCMECKCDPSDGECRNCNHEERAEKPKGCSEDTCSCVDCKCDHASMKCAVGCGRATDTNHNTFLHYHKRHNNSNLEDLGIYTVHECEEEATTTIVDSLKCKCSSDTGSCSSKSNNETDTKKDACCASNGTKTCCVTICFKKLDAFKQFLTDNELVQALKSSTINLTTSL